MKSSTSHFLSPLTIKRLRNFMRIRRAVASLVLLVSLFVLSLFSELICNSNPLYLRYQGKTFFPFLQSLTMRDLNGGQGEAMPVDYKQLTDSAEFKADPGNRAVWAPIAFGPSEVVDARTLDQYRTVRVSVVPEADVGRIDLAPDGTIAITVACSPFFPKGTKIRNAKLADYWQLPPEMIQAIESRRNGKADAAREFSITGKTGSAVVTMPETAAGPAPCLVRISFRQKEKPDSPYQLQLRRGKDQKIAGIPASIPAPAAKEIADLAARCFESPVETTVIPWRDRHAEVSCVRSEIVWPFRPVKGHYMGIDSAGRDVLARVLYGMRIALLFGIALALWSMCFGVTIGSIQGFFGGWVDITGQRLTEIWSALPFLYVMIFVGSALGRSFLLLLICYGLFNWITISYYMRAEFLRLRQRTFVEAARCQGLSSSRIIFSHILPNGLTPLITLFPFKLMGAIGSLAALDFLGFGLPPMTPSWGELLHQAQQFRWAWWLILFPAAALFTVMLLTVMIGEGLRDAFDPRQQSKLE
jgi:ABC-type uncharacterized transport system, permease component